MNVLVSILFTLLALAAGRAVLYPEGVTRLSPGCAARPWAEACNPFGVKNSTAKALQRSSPA